MSINLLRPVNIIALLIKIGFYYCLVSYGYDKKIKETPFFMTKFHDYSRIEEAFFLIDNNIDPYTIEHIFQVILI